MVTDEQVRLLRQKRMDGKTQEAAAAAAGMSVRSARKWEDGPVPSMTRRRRHWRTRKDPFEGIWEREVVALLEADEAGILEAKTILEQLETSYGEQIGGKQLRTLQRRVRQWRALHGPARDVIFPQVHPPGREAAYDFTHATSLGVRIAGEEFEHLLFEFCLSHSGWRWVSVEFGETYEALSACIQDALWELGGCPEVVRHDNLSAATHELGPTAERRRRSPTKRYEALLSHYGMRSTRIRPRKAHENGVAEKAHHRTKSILAQELVIRGSRDFDSDAEYVAWVRETIDRRVNRHVADRLAEERAQFRPLPATRLPSHTELTAVVRSWSTIQVQRRTYSVPSRLIDHQVGVRLHANHIEVFYGDRLVEEFPRLRGKASARIDYRHVIWSLVRKPGAFARYRFREELFPSITFRRAYDALVGWRGERADVEYVRILHLAASTRECEVGRALVEALGDGRRFDYAAIKARVAPERPKIPDVQLGVVDLTSYDALIGNAEEALG